ncbi:MAG TPA: C40 family peptidase [Candidatus Sulfotelmatobacter sp.]|nr:C40 family peptidase [Candidatus Sulfotelmatobacter sp.]
MRYIRHPFVLIIFTIALLCLAPSSAAGKSGTPPAASDNWVVIVPVANMYSSATENADVVSQAILGSDVVVLEKRHKWARIRTDDQYMGWMPFRNLRRLNAPYGAPGHVIQVESLFANLYREADVTEHRPIITVPFETHLEAIDDAPGNDQRWLEVRLPDGRMAWIQRSDTVRDPKPLTIEQSIELASRFLGLPYLWGGRSSFGYDCSGFMQMLVRSRGINMPRDANLQAAWGGVQAIDRKDLRAGDLLFFGESAEKITHTGMYMGGGDFIHDTTNGHPVIQISPLDDKPWTSILVACRRVK